MNLIKRRGSKSAAGAASLQPSGAFLRDVHECCSVEGQVGQVPDDDLLGRTVANLLECQDKKQLEDAAKFLGSQIRSENKQSVMFALHTLGTLMRTDKLAFHKIVGLNLTHVIKPMLTLVESSKKNPASTDPTVEKALELLQCWGEGFQGRSDMVVLCESYRGLLKKSWVKFPPRNHEWDPPSQARHVERSPASAAPASDDSWIRSEFEQFDRVLTNMESELKSTPDSAALAQNSLLSELAVECQKIGPQLQSMIEIVSTSTAGANLQLLLDLNERLLTSMDNYHRIESIPAYNPFDDETVMSQVFSNIDLSHPPRPMTTTTPNKKPNDEDEDVL